MAKARRHEPSDFSRFLAKGLNKETAAAYVGVTPSTFGKMVSAGQMPQPKVAGPYLLWDRYALDVHYRGLVEDGALPDDNPSPEPKVYVLGIPGFVKIGFTTRPIALRVAGLQTGSPHKLIVVSVQSGSRAEEIDLHCRFQACRAEGEWFRNEGAVAQWIAEGCPI